MHRHGAHTPSLHRPLQPDPPPAGAQDTPTYTLIDLGQPSTSGPVYISPNSGLVLDLGLDELYDIDTGTVTDISSPPPGFVPLQMNDDGQVVGNYFSGPDEGGAVWTPTTGALNIVSIATTVHTLQGGTCVQQGEDVNCPYEMQPAYPFIASGFNDQGDVVGQVSSQFDGNTGATFGYTYGEGQSFAAIAPGGDDADFTGTIPSDLYFPYNLASNWDQCGFNNNAVVETDTYSTSYSPYAYNAFAINNNDQILGTPCDGPNPLSAGGNGVPEVWSNGGSLSSS
jgi:hypothetical protein